MSKILANVSKIKFKTHKLFVKKILNQNLKAHNFVKTITTRHVLMDAIHVLMQMVCYLMQRYYFTKIVFSEWQKLLNQATTHVLARKHIFRFRKIRAKRKRWHYENILPHSNDDLKTKSQNEIFHDESKQTGLKCNFFEKYFWNYKWSCCNACHLNSCVFISGTFFKQTAQFHKNLKIHSKQKIIKYQSHGQEIVNLKSATK